MPENFQNLGLTMHTHTKFWKLPFFDLHLGLAFLFQQTWVWQPGNVLNSFWPAYSKSNSVDLLSVAAAIVQHYFVFTQFTLSSFYYFLYCGNPMTLHSRKTKGNNFSVEILFSSLTAKWGHLKLRYVEKINKYYCIKTNSNIALQNACT